MVGGRPLVLGDDARRKVCKARGLRRRQPGGRVEMSNGSRQANAVGVDWLGDIAHLLKVALPGMSVMMREGGRGGGEESQGSEKIGESGCATARLGERSAEQAQNFAQDVCMRCSLIGGEPVGAEGTTCSGGVGRRTHLHKTTPTADQVGHQRCRAALGFARTRMAPRVPRAASSGGQVSRKQGQGLKGGRSGAQAVCGGMRSGSTAHVVESKIKTQKCLASHVAQQGGQEGPNSLCRTRLGRAQGG